MAPGAAERRYGAENKMPVRVDCSYLVTAWAANSSGTPAYDEHRLLGEVMKVLPRHPVLPTSVLQGSLQGQDPPLPAVTLLSGSCKVWGNSGRPWAANRRRRSTTP
ncbi:MAG: Pvc16 family protein [Trichloromonas sp.]|nr:Pvc16 family protein [Trichloromonas sp.]